MSYVEIKFQVFRIDVMIKNKKLYIRYMWKMQDIIIWHIDIERLINYFSM